MGIAVLPERLVKARELIGHTRKSFSEELNIPYRTITNYENGSREPGSEYLTRIADICGCTTDWLLGLSDNPKREAQTLVKDSLFNTLKDNYDELNDEGRERLTSYSDDLVSSGKYIKEDNARLA
jgi:transcriptional regulator with XRE-family HTH domain